MASTGSPVDLPPVTTPEATAPRYAALSSLMAVKLRNYVDGRKPQESKFLNNYNDFMRIPTPTDTKGTGLPKSGKADALFIGSTQSKIRTARAKIKDVLFSNGETVPFDTEPFNAEVAPYSDTIKAILKQQLLDGDFVRTLGNIAVNQNCIFGTCHAAGPFVRTKTITKPRLEGGNLSQTSFEYPEPYFEAPLTMDVFPDPNATDTDPGEGVFWILSYSPETVRSWKKDKNFFNIDEAVATKTTAYQSHGSDLARASRGNSQLSADGRVEVARYFGLVPAEKLGLDETNSDNSAGDYVEAIIWMAGNIVIRVDKEPLSKRRFYRGVYEAVDGEYWGVGIAENNSPTQKLTNAAVRLFVTAKGIALNPPRSVDGSLFQAGEDFQFGPHKVLRMKHGLSPEQRNTAIITHTMPDVSEGWESLIAQADRISEDDTGIRKYQSGSDANQLNKTAHGISMIMNASALPLKEVLLNIDRMLIEPMIEALIEWDLKYLTPETVREIHGDETALRWMQIKTLGTTGFMDWRATGTSTFLAKEVMLQKMQGMVAIVGSNPAYMNLVDLREMLDQLWRLSEIGFKSPVISAEELQARQNQPPPPSIPPDQMELEKAKLATENRGLDVQHEKNISDMHKTHTGAVIKAAQLTMKAAAPDGPGNIGGGTYGQ